MPDARPGAKHPLRLWQVSALLALIEGNYPRFALWAVLQLFAGVRAGEALRFRGEWILAEARAVRIPGWGLDGKAGSKTRDDWALLDLPVGFWRWVEAHPAGPGPLAAPSRRRWRAIARELRSQGIIDRWESNAMRDSFATYHFSAYKDPLKTAALLKHRDSQMLYRSYLGCIRPQWEGLAYFQLLPGARFLARPGA